MSSEPEVYTRSPADALRLVVAVVLLLSYTLVATLFGDKLIGFASDVLRGLDAIPVWIVDTFAIAIRIAGIAFLALGVIVTAFRSNARMWLTVALASVAAAALVVLLEDIPDDKGANVVAIDTDLGILTDGSFPSAVGIGVMAAVLAAGAPWISRRWRRWGWVALCGMVLLRFLTTPLSFDTVRAALIGWVCGSAVLVALGAPLRRPTADGISEGLARAGLPLDSLKVASVDARGSTPYFGVGTDGTRYFVKALGVDQRSADIMFRLYRYTQRKDLGDERPFSSLRRAVEHEAFLALAARDLGVRTPRLRALATAEPNAFVLAYEAVDGKSLDGVPPEEMTDEILRAAWENIAQLRSYRIAHRDLRLANLFLASDGEVWMIDFGFSELAASDLLLANDVAELVASSGAVVGAERATAHARATVDADTLAAARDRLKLWALSGATRTAMKAQPGLLDDIRARLAPV